MAPRSLTPWRRTGRRQPPAAAAAPRPPRARHASPRAPRPAGRRRTAARLLAAILGVSAVAVGSGLLLHIHTYRQHSRSAAQHLLHAFTASTQTQLESGRSSCRGPLPSVGTDRTRARLILTIPAIGLTAPVLAGTQDAQLNQAVGHLDTSRWPDQSGTTVLEAHDVTFFSHLDHVRPGQSITLTDGCRRWTYTTERTAVVAQGSPVPALTAPTLDLITCWPTTALYYTHQRYLLTATLTTTTTTGPGVAAPTTPAEIRPALPPELVNRDLGPDTVHLPLGDLIIDPRLDASWRQSTGPLNASNATVELAVAAYLARGNAHADWWPTLAPTVPPAELAAVRQPFTWAGPATIRIIGTGTKPTGSTLHVNIRTSSGKHKQLTLDTNIDPRGNMKIIQIT